MVMVGVDSGSL